MATQTQLTPEQLKAIQTARNTQFMQLAHSQPIKANPLSTNTYSVGANLSYEAPLVNGGWAHQIVLRHKIEVDVTLNAGTATLNAAAPLNVAA